jgi:tetratricopeptide (TPR) repeat protein
VTRRPPRHPAPLLAWAAIAAPLLGGVVLAPGLAHADGGSCDVGRDPVVVPDHLTCSDGSASLSAPSSITRTPPLREAQRGADPEPPPPRPHAPPPRSGPDDAVGAQPFERARALAAEGQLDAAFTLLSETEVAFPRLVDRVALLRAELLIDAGRYEEALPALRQARASVDSAVRVEAEIAEVRVRILRDDPRAEGLLRALCGRYHELPSEADLRFLLGESLLRRERLTQAAEVFRKLDLHFPGSAPAQAGLVHLERCAPTACACAAS